MRTEWRDHDPRSRPAAPAATCSPGVAVADELRARDPNTRVIFVGTPKGLESRLVPRAGYELELLPILPLNGVGPLRMLKGLAALPWAMLQGGRAGGPAAAPAPSSAWAATPAGRSSSPRPPSASTP